MIPQAQSQSNIEWRQTFGISTNSEAEHRVKKFAHTNESQQKQTVFEPKKSTHIEHELNACFLARIQRLNLWFMQRERTIFIIIHRDSSHDEYICEM